MTPTEIVLAFLTAAFVEFVETVLQGGDASNITNYVSLDQCAHHNLMVADGLDGLGAVLAGTAEQGIEIIYTATPLVVAEGNFVSTGSEGTFGVEPTAFFDLFRVEDGKIVDHWDAIQAIPGEMAHNKGKFWNSSLKGEGGLRLQFRREAAQISAI